MNMKVNIKVIPRSSVQHIQESLDGNLKVKLKSAPVKGQANQELIELLAKYYKVSKSQVEIVKGLASKNKVVEVDN